MSFNLILSGVGGQGILTISTILGQAALKKSLHVKQSEVHGMAQRGGAVVSHFRLSADFIASDLIPRGSADMILSLEPLEGLRYLEYLKDGGQFISSDSPFTNIDNYPSLDDILAEIKRIPEHLLVNAEEIAGSEGLKRGMNIVMLGAASSWLPLEAELIKNEIKLYFEDKGERIVDTNLTLYEAGVATEAE